MAPSPDLKSIEEAEASSTVNIAGERRKERGGDASKRSASPQHDDTQLEILQELRATREVCKKINWGVVAIVIILIFVLFKFGLIK